MSENSETSSSHEAASALPWFRVRLDDGREIEIHSVDAIQIFRKDFEELVLQPSQTNTHEARALRMEMRTPRGESSDFPTIKTSKSTLENLKALFQTPWARTGKTVTELTEALEVNAVPDKPNNISSYLTRLVKAGVIRRIERDGVYHFYPLPKTQ